MKIIKTNIGEDAGSLGAAALAAVGSGLWSDFSKMDQIHQVESTFEPIPDNTATYRKLDPVYEMLRQAQGQIGTTLADLDI